ncbi:MAG: hypothetical protein FWH43_07255 [Endomicrobia bacterium]|nr:hypothetical protein [Endomicrobiia bacterium]MCL2145266.1 hypothetical protein [Endomicrobiia bacterium]
MNAFNVNLNFKLSKEEAPELGPKIGKCMAFALAVIFTNMIFAVLGIIRFVRIDIYGAYNILFFVLLLIFAALFPAAIFFFIQKYVIIAVTKAGYKKMTPFFKTVCFVIAERYAADDNFQEKINKAFDIGADAGVIYDKNAPWPVKKAVSFFINRLPFVDFLKNMSPGINKKDIRAISECVYVQMNDYAVNKLFPSNNLKTVFALYAVNLAAQVLLLYIIR